MTKTPLKKTEQNARPQTSGKESSAQIPEQSQKSVKTVPDATAKKTQPQKHAYKKCARKECTSAKKNDRSPRKKSTKFSFARWWDEWKMAFAGVVLALRKPKFVVVVLITLVFFGTLMNLLTGGLSQFLLLFKLDWSGKGRVLASALLATVGVGRAFWDWAVVFGIALLQGILIGLMAIVWRYNRTPSEKTTRKKAESAQKSASILLSHANSVNAESAGLVAGLAILSAGCPTCGTSLLLPLIGTFTSSAGAIAGALSGVALTLAVVVALLSLKRVGREVYVIMKANRRAAKRAEHGSKNGD